MTPFLSTFVGLQPKRWLPYLSVAVLLHLALIQLAFSPFSTLSSLEPTEQFIAADLHLMAKPAPVPKANPPKAKPAVSESEPDESPAPAATTETTPVDPGKFASDLMPGATGNSADISKEPISLGPVTHYSVNPPPSAELKYDAQSQHKGQNIYGSGRIHWQSNGNTFSIKGEFNVLFLSLLNFTSEGTIDPKTGVSPTVYAEKRMRRAETNTHFHRERNTISFSSSTLSYERPGGEQDRASIVWQLVGIGRRHGDKFSPGGVLDIAVAGVRNADVWKIRIVGIEEIETGLGKVRAWRLARSARKGTYEQSLDVWLAPQHEWYPVKVRYTNDNGDFLDLSLSEINKPDNR
jgi:hypothetical protein